MGWEESFADLTTGQKLDYDDGIADILDVVSKKWKVISEKRVKKRLKQEVRDKARREADIKRRKAKAQKIYDRQKKRDEEEQRRFERARARGGMPGMGMPGGMGMPPGMDPNLLAGLFANMKGGKGGCCFGKGAAPPGRAEEEEKDGPTIE